MAVKKRVTLHPLKADGNVDVKVELYPKTFLDGIVDRDGNEVHVATVEDLNDVTADFDDRLNNVEVEVSTKQNNLIPGDGISIVDNVISVDAPTNVYTKEEADEKFATIANVDAAIANVNTAIDGIDATIEDIDTALEDKVSLKEFDDAIAVANKNAEVDLNDYYTNTSLNSLANFLAGTKELNAGQSEFIFDFDGEETELDFDELKNYDSIKLSMDYIVENTPAVEVEPEEKQGNLYFRRSVDEEQEPIFTFMDYQNKKVIKAILRPNRIIGQYVTTDSNIKILSLCKCIEYNDNGGGTERGNNCTWMHYSNTSYDYRFVGNLEDYVFTLKDAPVYNTSGGYTPVEMAGILGKGTLREKESSDSNLEEYLPAQDVKLVLAQLEDCFHLCQLLDHYWGSASWYNPDYPESQDNPRIWYLFVLGAWGDQQGDGEYIQFIPYYADDNPMALDAVANPKAASSSQSELLYYNVSVYYTPIIQQIQQAKENIQKILGTASWWNNSKTYSKGDIVIKSYSYYNYGSYFEQYYLYRSKVNNNYWNYPDPNSSDYYWELITVEKLTQELANCIKVDTRTNVEKLTALKNLLLTLDGNNPTAFEETFEFNGITHEDCAAVLSDAISGYYNSIIFETDNPINYLRSGELLICNDLKHFTVMGAEQDGKFRFEMTYPEPSVVTGGVYDAESEYPSNISFELDPGNDYSEPTCSICSSGKIYIKFAPQVVLSVDEGR